MLYTRGLVRSVVGDVVLHVIYNFPGVSLRLMMLVLLRLDLSPVLAASPRVHQLLIEVVVVVLVEVSVGHGECDTGITRAREHLFTFASAGVVAQEACARGFKGPSELRPPPYWSITYLTSSTRCRKPPLIR